MYLLTYIKEYVPCHYEHPPSPIGVANTLLHHLPQHQYKPFCKLSKKIRNTF